MSSIVSKHSTDLRPLYAHGWNEADLRILWLYSSYRPYKILQETSPIYVNYDDESEEKEFQDQTRPQLQGQRPSSSLSDRIVEFSVQCAIQLRRSPIPSQLYHLLTCGNTIWRWLDTRFQISTQFLFACTTLTHYSMMGVQVMTRACVESWIAYFSMPPYQQRNNFGDDPEEDGDSIVSFCIGGETFMTRKSTILASKSCKLVKLLIPPVSAKMPFIDRDGSSFRTILNYLRNMHSPNAASVLLASLKTLSIEKLTAIRQEAAYYELPQLIRFLEIEIKRRI